MKYQVLIGPAGQPDYQPDDVTATVNADNKLDASYQAALLLAAEQRRPVSILRTWVVKSVRGEDEATRLAAEPAGIRDVVTTRHGYPAEMARPWSPGNRPGPDAPPPEPRIPPRGCGVHHTGDCLFEHPFDPR